ncbi:MAG: peptide-methionine (S)-S-oxide reductase [Glaciecola sp.]|uniref:peptide-methionine (S)-S-oxide reductase MsrA n=1 Tax=Congregibacter sp. TaxID=2744308 RepID=UPI0039E279E5
MKLFELRKKHALPDAQSALPGRDTPLAVAERHQVLDAPMRGPFPAPMQQVVFGMGCFWGVERLFWQREGVFTTAAGYAGGHTPNPGYDEVCSGRTGHTEVVLVVFDPARVAFDDLLRIFWEGHNPTQGMRQGNDMGTQYRSAIYVSDETQLTAAKDSMAAYQSQLDDSGYDGITTDIDMAGPFYYAEDYHQQYLHKNPAGYCGLGGTGVTCPIGLGVA